MYTFSRPDPGGARPGPVGSLEIGAMVVYNGYYKVINMDIELIKLEYQGKNITIIPTAHVSKNSAELVARTIDEIHPDTICVELDKDRLESLRNPDKKESAICWQI